MLKFQYCNVPYPPIDKEIKDKIIKDHFTKVCREKCAKTGGEDCKKCREFWFINEQKGYIYGYE